MFGVFASTILSNHIVHHIIRKVNETGEATSPISVEIYSKKAHKESSKTSRGLISKILIRRKAHLD